jgi:succinyl-diaminopimelate desuccinylase
MMRVPAVRWLLLGSILSFRTTAAQTIDSTALVRLTCDAVHFPTYAGNKSAVEDQARWLEDIGKRLGFQVRRAGPVTEIELPGPQRAPVLGLVVHGDVMPADPRNWKFSPFECALVNGNVRGRGTSDDKGALAQALVAMSALQRSGRARTHVVRLLVGSDEESTGEDINVYLRDHRAPDYSLVLDLNFPVVIGEKAWNTLTVKTSLTERPRPESGFRVVDLSAGLDPAIVPDQAVLKLQAVDSARPDWEPLKKALNSRSPDIGTSVDVVVSGSVLTLTVRGKAAHGGANIENGRNALVSLAHLTNGLLPAGGADDLLKFAAMAGQDVYGTGLGLTQSYGAWGRYSVNVAVIEKSATGEYGLTVVTRRTPPLTGAELRNRLYKRVDEFNRDTGARLVASGEFTDNPLVLDPQAKLIQRLYSIYERVTGQKDAFVISGASSYAKRLPNSVPFGMWFPGKPVPWHDVDEQISLSDLERGASILIEAVAELACGPRLVDPLKP